MAPYCNRCERPFAHNRAYQDHINNNSRHNVCFVCDKDYENQNHLRQHERDKHNACSDCETTFSAPSNLSAHLRSEFHVGRKYTCACNEGFASPAGLLLHIERGGCTEYTGHELMHLISVGVRRRAVGYCKPGADIRMPRKDIFIVDPVEALRKESRGHTDVAYHQRFQNYVCQYCLDYFDYPSGLNQHLADSSSKSGGVRYICDDCDGEFDYPSGLCQHYESRCCQK